jgi:UV DNA damage repair endonuclease
MGNSHKNLRLEPVAQLEPNFDTKRFLWEFPIGSYVKLSSAVAAILVGGLKCRTQVWKGTTQESFQESLVEIGSVVSEEKIFFKFHPKN